VFDGVTPLLASVLNGHLPIVKCLIQNGADVNQAAKNGMTALAVAIEINSPEVAKFLIRNHANIELTTLCFKKHKAFELFEILDKLCNEMEMEEDIE
jgi:ankyrin repeat protein